MLVDGSHSHLFKSSRGLREGNPLSSFLITVVVEALNLLFMKAKDVSLLEGFQASRSGVVITHLQF